MHEAVVLDPLEDHLRHRIVQIILFLARLGHKYAQVPVQIVANPKAHVQRSHTVHVWQNGDLKVSTLISTRDPELQLAPGDFEQVSGRMVRLDRVSVLFAVGVRAVTAASGQHVENAPALGENVEAQLHLLLCIDRFQVERLIRIDLIADVPVQPSERQLDVKARVLAAPFLQIIDLIDF